MTALSASQKQDVPLSLALILLLAVVGMLVIGTSLTAWEAKAVALDRFIATNGVMLTVGLGAILFNSLSLGMELRRRFGIRRQGGRLRLLRREPLEISKTQWIVIGIGLGLGVAGYFAASLSLPPIRNAFFGINVARWS